MGSGDAPDTANDTEPSDAVAPDASPCVDDEACDDGDPCTLEDRCREGLCRGQAILCEPSMHPCRDTACNPASGLCVELAADDGNACDDHDACTDDDRCVALDCVGTPVVCDTTECAGATCDPQRGACVNPQGIACDALCTTDCPCPTPTITCTRSGRVLTCTAGVTSGVLQTSTWTLSRPEGGVAVLRQSADARQVAVTMLVSGTFTLGLDVTDINGVAACAPVQHVEEAGGRSAPASWWCSSGTRPTTPTSSTSARRSAGRRSAPT